MLVFMLTNNLSVIWVSKKFPFLINLIFPILDLDIASTTIALPDKIKK